MIHAGYRKQRYCSKSSHQHFQLIPVGSIFLMAKIEIGLTDVFKGCRTACEYIATYINNFITK